MNELGISEYLLDTVEPTLEKSKATGKNVLAIKLSKRKIITGKETELLSAPSALIINAIKTLSKIPDNIDLLSPSVLEPILKQRKSKTPLHLPEVMIALSVCSVTNPVVEKALSTLNKLKNCEAHASYIVTNGDKKALTELGIRLTCEDKYYSEPFSENIKDVLMGIVFIIIPVLHSYCSNEEKGNDLQKIEVNLKLLESKSDSLMQNDNIEITLK